MMQTAIDPSTIKWYIRGLTDTGTSIVMPVLVTKKLYMDVDCYIGRNSESGSYHHILRNDDSWGYGGLAIQKTWNQFMSGNSVAYLTLPYNRIVIDLPNSIRTAYNATTSATITRTQSGAYTNTTTLKLFLKNTFAYHRVYINDGTNEYDLVAGYDSSHNPCLTDILTGTNYYPVGDAEIVRNPAK